MISLPTRITVNFMGNTKVHHAYTATPKKTDQTIEKIIEHKKLVKFRALFLQIIYIIYISLASRTGAKRRVRSCSERWRHRKRAPTKLLQQLSQLNQSTHLFLHFSVIFL